jgi:transposase InsO family protein
MGQILHGRATTTEAIRRAIQNSEESLRALSARYGINQKTVAKWRKRTSVADLPTGPKDATSTVLTRDEEAIIVAFRRHTLLPLDDCLYSLQATIPHLSRSSLQRCLQRHDISRLPEVEGDKPAKRKFKAYPLGYFHVDIAEVQTAEGKLYLFVAIDRTSKFAFVELHQKAGKMAAAAFLRNLVAAVPYRLNIVLTDNGIQFTNHDRHIYAFEHIFDRVCREHQIDHRLTKIKRPWTNGQVERMNRTIKDATVKRFHYDDHDQLRAHLANFISAYNFGRRLKTLKGLTPYEFICKQWTIEPERYTLNPIHQMPGLNT